MAKKKPAIVISLFILMLFQAVSGLYGGFGLITDPSGKSLQIPIEWLESSPFDNYLIPGIILFVVLGVAPMIVLFGLWNGKHWGLLGSLFLGAALVIWIIVEVIIVGYKAYPPLQVMYGLIGVIIIVLANFPEIKNFYSTEEDEQVKNDES